MMSDKIHAALDGELYPDALDPEERQIYERFLAEAEAARDALSHRRAPDLSRAVMAEIEEIERREARNRASGRVGAAWAAAWHWLLAPRAVMLRPAYALAAALLLALGGGLMLAESTGADGGTVAATVDEPQIYVRFDLTAESASSVRLAGSFTGWAPSIDLQPAGAGRWSALVPLRAGIHDYAFVVDGERWVADPAAPTVADGFGGQNSRLSLVLASSL
jgi:hypothetical protein